MAKFARFALPVLLLAIFALQAVMSMHLTSITFDETAHLPAGYAYWKTLDIRLNLEHPPFVKLLCAAPLLVLGPEMDLSAPDYAGEEPNEWTFGARFLEQNDIERLMFWGRLPVALLGVILGIYVFCWAGKLYGNKAALLALFFYAFSPNIIAHSRLVTTDLAMSCFTTMTFYHWWRFLRKPVLKRHLLFTGLSLGLALATKYLAITLIPLLALMMLIVLNETDRVNSSRVQTDLLCNGIIYSAIAFAVAGFVVWATYFFPLSTDFYTKGMGYITATRFTRPDDAYLLGHVKHGGWAFYFVAAFLLKSEIPFLLTLGTRFAFFKQVKITRDDLFLLLPVLLIFGVVSPRAANIGVRYVLPAYPFLIIFASRLVEPVFQRRYLRVIAYVFIFWQVGSALRAYPDYLGYYNEAAGGMRRAPYVLTDSNTDWGQGLIMLRKYMDDTGIKNIKLRYGGNIDPKAYGVSFTPVSDAEWNSTPRGGLYAASTGELVKKRITYQNAPVPGNWLDSYQPIERIGASIWVYDFSSAGQRQDD